MEWNAPVYVVFAVYTALWPWLSNFGLWPNPGDLLHTYWGIVAVDFEVSSCVRAPWGQYQSLSTSAGPTANEEPQQAAGEPTDEFFF